MNFEQTLTFYRKKINEELELLFNNKINNTDDFINFVSHKIKEYVLCGGKRLRPILLIMAYKALGGTNQEINKAALSIELLHNSTLVHDDIMDEDEKRRNKPTINKIMKAHFLKTNKETNYNGLLFNKSSSRFSVSNAICAGNLLYSFGESCLANINFNAQSVKKALNVYSKAYTIVNNGQILDTLFELKDVKENEYLRMIEQKTANLFKASVAIGASLANASKEQITLLENYALNFGIAFQLQDDLIDTKKSKGRKLGTDIKKGKKTLLVIKALEKANTEQRKILLDILGKENASEEEINKVIEIFKETEAIDYVKELANKKIKESKEQIKKSNIKEKEFFNKIADIIRD